ESEYENKALQRIQMRQERELLKTESSRFDGSNMIKSHVEEELRRKLDTVQSAYKKELAQEKNHSKDIQKQLHTLSTEHEMLQKKLSSKQHSPQTFFFKNANSESQNFDKGIGSFLTNLDREKKERLLAKLREIDLSGTIFEGNIRRPQAARRFSMDSQRSNFTVKSPDLEPKQTLYQTRMFRNCPNYLSTDVNMREDPEARRVDEVHIKPFFDYKGGNITGVALNSTEPANSAFVFMLQSITSNFKEVAHIVPVHRADAKFLHKMLRDVICELENIGYRVVCVE
ncbi:hypothetical protein HPB47_005071, partial [Ixodes persulcatus]